MHPESIYLFPRRSCSPIVCLINDSIEKRYPFETEISFVKTNGKIKQVVYLNDQCFIKRWMFKNDFIFRLLDFGSIIFNKISMSTPEGRKTNVDE